MTDADGKSICLTHKNGRKGNNIVLLSYLAKKHEVSFSVSARDCALPVIQ
jgi:hypothetical protein